MKLYQIFESNQADELVKDLIAKMKAKMPKPMDRTTKKTTTNVSGSIKGLNMAAARKTQEYLEIYNSVRSSHRRTKLGLADMRYKKALLMGKIKPLPGVTVIRN